MVSFFPTQLDQQKYYNKLVNERQMSGFLSRGYGERFDPFLLDRKPFLAEIYEQLFKGILGDSGPRLLDIGCGTGFYWNVLRKYCASITGLDSNDSMIGEAGRFIQDKRLTGIKVETGNAEKMKFPHNSFDAVLCIDLLHHAIDVEACLREFYRVLRPGGRVYVIEPNCLNPLMFLVHAVPKEERRGVYRNNEFYLRHKIKKHFLNARHSYINFIVSLRTSKEAEVLKQIDKILDFSMMRWLSFRQLLVADK